MNFERIYSVRIKEEVREEMVEQGFNVVLADMLKTKKILVKEGLYTIMLRKLEKEIFKVLQGKSLEEIQEFLDNTVNVDQSNVTVETSCNDEVQMLLKEFGYEGNEQYKIRYHVYQNSKYVEQTAYTITEVKLKKKFATGSWRLTRSFNQFLFVNLANIVAEQYLINNLSTFMVQNREELQVQFLHDCREIEGKHEVASDVLLEKLQTLADKYYPKQLSFKQGKSYGFYYTSMFSILFLEDEEFNKNPIKLQSCRKSLLDFVMYHFMEAINEVEEKVKRNRDAMSDYARAFETKKHIKRTHEAKMKDNAFLKRYSYVEIDNDCDLEKFEKLEDEFTKLIGSIPYPSLEGSFRIKKLGKHRAAGIFFPHVNATIIDLNHVDSMIHEFAHSLDYQFKVGKKILSECAEFKSILLSYRDEVDEFVRENFNTEKLSDWNKSSRGKRYFYTPTEIFARSMELYFFHKGIQTSFLRESYNSYYYPGSTSYLDQVNNYFNDLFQKEEFQCIELDTEIKLETEAIYRNLVLQEQYECELLIQESGQLSLIF